MRQHGAAMNEATTTPPPPERLVTALVSAGLSRATAMEMAPTKAEEVLLLLGPWGVRTVRSQAARAARAQRTCPA